MDWKTKKISDAEKDVMLALWESGSSLRAGEIVKILQKDGVREWKTQTAHVLLRRLCEKGYLSVDKKGYYHKFTPLVSKEEYTARASEQLLEEIANPHVLKRQYLGAFAPMVVASLIDTEELTEEDIDTLTRLLNEKKAALNSKKDD